MSGTVCDDVVAGIASWITSCPAPAVWTAHTKLNFPSSHNRRNQSRLYAPAGLMPRTPAAFPRRYYRHHEIFHADWDRLDEGVSGLNGTRLLVSYSPDLHGTVEDPVAAVFLAAMTLLRTSLVSKLAFTSSKTTAITWTSISLAFPSILLSLPRPDYSPYY